MEAKWSGQCAKCDTTYQRGDQIKPQYRRDGFNPDTGKPVWVRVPKAYVHAPRCPKVTRNAPGQTPVRLCPECNMPRSDGGNVCPHCGTVTESPRQLTFGGTP